MPSIILKSFEKFLRNKWFIILFIIPVSVYLFLLLKYAQNIPATDDFNATLQFINMFVYGKLDGIQQISVLFSQHNEHRIAVSRLLALLLYAVAGKVNFIHFVLLDSFFLFGLVGSLLLLYNKLEPDARWYSYLLPVLLLVSPKSYETFLFVSGGSQSYTVLLFTVLSLWLLSLSSVAKDNKHNLLFSLSVISAVLATFSFGSGFLVWIGGIMFLFYSHKWRKLLLWIFLSGLVCGYYFHDFYRTSAVSEDTYSLFSLFINVAKGFVLFPGASFMLYWPSFLLTKLQVLLCYLIGLLSCLYFAYLFVTGYGRRCPLLFSLLTVAVGTDAILAVSRSGAGSSFVFTSRYVVFTSFLSIVTYYILVQQRSKFFYNRSWFVTPLYILFINSLLVSVPQMDVIYKDRQVGFEAWYRNKTPTLYIDSTMQKEANRIINQSIQTGVFVPRLEQSGGSSQRDKIY